jgi:hypothetical protein
MERKTEQSVVRSAVRAAKGYQRREGHLPSRDEIGSLQIQVARPLTRLAFIGCGLFSLSFSYGAFLAAEYGGMALFLALGILLVVVGIRGRKKELQSVVDSGDADGLVDVVEAIMDTLDSL